MGSYQTPICDIEPVTNPILFDGFTALFVFVQLLLLIHSLHIEWSKRNDPNFQILSTQSRLGYIILQCLALYWTTSDLVRYIIDPLESFLPNTIGCVVLTYSTKLIPSLFYMVYLYLVLLRLQNLDGTYLNTSKCTIVTLRIFICSLMGFQIAYLCIDDDPVCLYPLHPSDMDRELFYCELMPTTNRAYLLLVGITVIALLNMVMGVLFTRKLQQVVHLMEDNQHVNLQLRKIVVQNTILIATGSISTLACYVLWFMFPIPTGFWLYLDLIVNCIVIGLSFPHNRKWYKRLCGCCIKCCWKKFDALGVELNQPVPENNMAIINENIVLELGPGLIPQNKGETRALRSSPKKVKKGMRQKWRALVRLNKPSGSLCASDPGQSDAASSFPNFMNSTLSSFSDTDPAVMSITDTSSEPNMIRSIGETVNT